LLVSDSPALMESMLSKFSHKSDRKPAQLLAGFSHRHERSNFIRFTSLIDRPNNAMNRIGTERMPQFFSDNMASLSSTLSAVSAETVEVRGDGGAVRQTVTYEWSQ